MRGAEEQSVFLHSHLTFFFLGQPFFLLSSSATSTRTSTGRGLIMPCSSFGRRVYYEFIDFNPLLDSSCMDMTDWVKIAETIQTHYDAWDGFVVLHGVYVAA